MEYETPLRAVYLFRYLGRPFSSSDTDWPEVEQNLWRAQGKWGHLEKILGREGADKITVGRFYVAEVQAVPLSGSKMWVLILWLDKYLERFHQWAVRRIAVMGPRRQQDGTWVYTPIWEVL